MNMNYEEMLNKIESLKTVNGGWTRESLKSLGVEWPPRKGWKAELLEKAKQSETIR